MSPSFEEKDARYGIHGEVDPPKESSHSSETYSLPHGKHGFDPLAIVGFSLRFPQDATTPEAFWKMLIEGRSAMTEFPMDRMNIDAFHHPDPNRTDTVSKLKHQCSLIRLCAPGNQCLSKGRKLRF